MATVPAVAGAGFRGVYATQEQTMWCWVACAQMVLAHLGETPVPRQCEIARRRFTNDDCCADPTPCNQPHPMNGIAQLYDLLGVSCRDISSHVPQETLMNEIFAERPVQVGYTYRTTTVGHVVVVIGEHTRPRTGQKYLRVADPREKNGKQSLLFEDVCTDSGKGTWSYTWIMMMKVAS